MKTPVRFEFDIAADHLVNHRGAPAYREPRQLTDPARAAAAYRATARACAIHGAPISIPR